MCTNIKEMKEWTTTQYNIHHTYTFISLSVYAFVNCLLKGYSTLRWRRAILFSIIIFKYILLHAKFFFFIFILFVLLFLLCVAVISCVFFAFFLILFSYTTFLLFAFCILSTVVGVWRGSFYQWTWYGIFFL